MLLMGIAMHTDRSGPMQKLEFARIRTDFGLVGDVRARSGSKRQVTALSQESWREARRELGFGTNMDWSKRRANLLISGIRFDSHHVGGRLGIRDVVLLITGECSPCSRMDEQVPGLTAALTPDWRAGVTCSVLAGGYIHRWDEVKLIDDDAQ